MQIHTHSTKVSGINRKHKATISCFRIACNFAASSLGRVRSLAALMPLVKLLLIICCCTYLPTQCVAVGYSYSRFVGPVSGPEHKVLVYDALSGGARVDFVAKPEYEFAYGIEDGPTRVLQNHKETRDGDAVKGVYSVVDPDGTLRVVKYTADNVNGFQAEIITNGVTTNHGHNADDVAAGGKDERNWQMVHTLPPPILHEVQHVVGGGQQNQAVAANEEEDVPVNNSVQVVDHAEDDDDDDDASESEHDELEESEEDDGYEEAAENAQSYEEQDGEEEGSDEYY